MTATKSPKKSGWDTVAADWFGVKKGKGGGKGTKGSGELEQLFILGVVLLIIYLSVTAALRAITNWWNQSFWPWFEEWRPWLTAGGLVLATLAATAAVLWARARWRDRPRRAIQKRVEDRQPDDVPTKPRVLGVDDDGQATAIAVPLPKGKPTTEKTAKQLADHHGRGEWGEAGEHELRFDPETKRDEIVVRRPVPEPVDDRSQVEQDLTKIAQEQLPHVTAVTVAGRDSDGNITRINVHHEVTAKLLSSPAVAEAIERALAAQLGWTDPNLYQMHWDRDANVGILEQCDDPLPHVVPFPFGRITDIIDRESKRLYYGVTASGQLAYWDLDRAPHTLIAGKTGSGKTVALTAFVVMALLMGWRVVMVDPKKLAFRDLDGLPNFERHGDAKGLDSAREIAASIDAIHDLMEKRYDLPRSELKKTQRVLFVVDETFIGFAALNDLWAEERPEGDRSKEHPSIGKLGRISALGREANIHVMLAIQRPDTALMGTVAGFMRSNLDNKITLGPMDPDGAPMMFGRGTKWVKVAQEIPAVKGRALIPLPEGVIGYQSAQVWFVDVDNESDLTEIERLVVEMHGRQSRLVDAPEHDPAPDDEADNGAGGGDTPVDLDKSEPEKEPEVPPVAKKAVSRRPRKKAAARPPASDDGPEVIGRENVLVGAKDTDGSYKLKRGAWTVIVPDGGGEPRNVRIATVTVDEDEDTVTIAGFGWKRVYATTDTVPLLMIAE